MRILSCVVHYLCNVKILSVIMMCFLKFIIEQFEYYCIVGLIA